MGTHENLVYVGDQDFETKVLKSDSPVVVDFWAEWCGPCKSIAPYYEQLSDEYKGKLSFAKVDTDANPRTRVAWVFRVFLPLSSLKVVLKLGASLVRIVFV